MGKEVKSGESSRFLSQAEEFLASAKENAASGRFNAAAFDAVQAMMNANDALTIHHLGQRASADHHEGLKLHADVVKILNDGSQRTRLKQAMELRSQAGYMGETISKNEAETTVRHAAQFLNWVRERIK